jgi:hypothetical protein
MALSPPHAALRRMGMNNEFNYRWDNPIQIRTSSNKTTAADRNPPASKTSPGSCSGVQITIMPAERPFYSVAFARKSWRAENNRTAPKKGTNTQPAFASGTTGMCLSPRSFPLLLSPLSSFSSLLPFPLSWLAKASVGKSKVVASKAQTRRTRFCNRE